MATRRAFLAALSAAGAGMVYDPEFALWKPGARTFFLPSPPCELEVGQLLVETASDRWLDQSRLSDLGRALLAQREHWARGAIQVMRVTRDYLTGTATVDVRWLHGLSRPVIARDVRVPWTTPNGAISPGWGDSLKFRPLRHPELLRFRS